MVGIDESLFCLVDNLEGVESVKPQVKISISSASNFHEVSPDLYTY